jgi:putative FmdB family regulatory protein
MPFKEVRSMPVYEYECESCGGRFEVIQKISDPVPTSCSLCHAGKVRKVLSPTAFVLKGSGWYATDYPSADRKKGAESEKPAAPASDAKTSACAGSCASGCCPSKG